MKKQIIYRYIMCLMLVIVLPFSSLFNLAFTNNTVYAEEPVFQEWDGTYQAGLTFNGSGTQASPYLIENAEQLASFSYKITNNIDTSLYNTDSSHFKLTVNIDLKGFEWNPIGKDGGTTRSFFGHFDGGYKIIKGLKITSQSNYAGLGFFSKTSNAEIKNVILDSVDINTGVASVSILYIGSLAGEIWDETVIKNCQTVSGNMQTNVQTESYCGGIVGRAEGSQIKNCTNGVTIIASTKNRKVAVGGIAGRISNTTVEKCNNTAELKNKDVGNQVGVNPYIYYIGGITGEIASNSLISSSYNSGKLSIDISTGYSAKFVYGGIAGWNDDEQNRSRIVNCFNIGTIEWNYPDCSIATLEDRTIVAGGIIGINGRESSVFQSLITNCYNYSVYSAISGTSDFIGSVVGKNISPSTFSDIRTNTITQNPCGVDISSQDFSKCLSLSAVQFADDENTTTNFPNWDFTDVWCYSEEFNGGQSPYLLGVGFKDYDPWVVKYNVDGEVIATLLVEDGELLTEPEEPDKTGHDFDGWRTASDFSGDSWNFASMKVTGNLILYAKFNKISYLVSFDSNGGSSVLNQNVLYDELIVEPTDPTKFGWEFDGWFIENDLSGDSWNFSEDTVTESITLHAKWIVKVYNVSLYIDGQLTETLSVEHNDTVDFPSFSKTGHTLSNWFTELSMQNLFPLQSPVTSNLSLYAQFTINRYTITFNSNGGSAVTTIEQNYGTLVSQPANPIRENYDFIGWYEDSDFSQPDYDFENKYIFNKIEARNVTLFAFWTKGQATVTIHSYYETTLGDYFPGITGGSVGFTDQCGQSSMSTPVEIDLTRDIYAMESVGYTFVGWYLVYDFSAEPDINAVLSQNVYTANTGTVTSEGMVLYARFDITRLEVVLEYQGDLTVSGGGTYYYGDTVTVSATAASEGYRFYQWKEYLTVVSEESVYEFIVTANTRLTATCKIYVRIEENENGTIDILNTEESYFEYQQELTVEAIANLGYDFYHWNTSGMENFDSQFNFTVTAPITLSVTFSSKPVTVIITTDSHGDLTGSTDTDEVSYKIGDVIWLRVVATPSDNYNFLNWTTDSHGSFTASSSIFNYRIVAEDAEQGTITFHANIYKSKMSVTITVYGTGSVNIDSSAGITSSYSTYLTFDTVFNAQFFSGQKYYLGQVIYKNIETQESEDMFDRINEENILSFNVLEDFDLDIYFAPMLWTDVMTEFEGIGTKANPYLITSPEEFAFMAYCINNDIPNAEGANYNIAYYKLAGDIDFSGRFWTPIGIDELNKRFDGVLDKNYVTLLNIDLVNWNVPYVYAGLFGCIGVGIIINETRPVWLLVGFISGFVFILALIGLIILIKSIRRKPKRVFIIPVDIQRRKK